MSRLEELAEKRACYEALKANIIFHGEMVLSCGCWHYDLYGLGKLEGQLGHMQLLAERMREVLQGIQQLEREILAP